MLRSHGPANARGGRKPKGNRLDERRDCDWHVVPYCEDSVGRRGSHALESSLLHKPVPSHHFQYSKSRASTAPSPFGWACFPDLKSNFQSDHDSYQSLHTRGPYAYYSLALLLIPWQHHSKSRSALGNHWFLPCLLTILGAPSIL